MRSIPAPRSRRRSPDRTIDELIVADSGLDDDRLLEIVEAAHRRGVKVRVAPRTTELLIERGEYVPGQGVPLFELRPPIFAGTDWATKRVFDLVVGVLIVVVGSADLALDRRRDQADLARPRVLCRPPHRARRAVRSRCSSSERWCGTPTSRRSRSQRANEASGALFKIRDDPRVTRVGRCLRRFSIDEIPNVAQCAARRDVAGRPAAAAAARLRAARAVAPAPLQRAARA